MSTYCPVTAGAPARGPGADLESQHHAPRGPTTLQIALGDGSVPERVGNGGRLQNRLHRGRPVILETNDLASQRSAAAAGIGIANLPDFLANGPPKLTKVPIPGGELLREMWIVIHADMRRSPPVRIVVDFLADLLGALPAGSR